VLRDLAVVVAALGYRLTGGEGERSLVSK